MPGIAGFINRGSRETGDETLRVMAECMKHEKFYTTERYVNEELGVYVGWAVHKDSFADCLPIYNEAKDVICVFYGEDHMDTDEIKRIGNGKLGSSVPKASYLAYLYENDEEGFFEKLNGWFSGLMVDLRKKKAILFNDRFGMQRIYVHEEKDILYFASEAKCILRVKPELRSIDPQSLADVLTCQCVLGNRSLFRGIDCLPGGSCWEIEPGKDIRKKRYFEPLEYENSPELTREHFLSGLKESLREILPKYLVCEGKIAFSLTGGLDTRTILANIPGPLSNVECYSHAGAYRDSYDVKIARAVSKICNLKHHTFRIDKKFFSDFPLLANKTAFITDGYMNLNGTPSLYLHGKARSIGSVRLTGNFGDQVLAGRTNLGVTYREPEAFSDDLREYMVQSRERFREVVAKHPLTLFLFNQAPWLDYSRYSLEQSQLVQRSPFMDNDLIKVLYQAPKNMLTSEDIRIRLIRDGNPGLARIPTDRGLLGSSNLFVSKSLHLYKELLFKLEYYFSYGMPHWTCRLNNALGFLNVDYLVLERNKYYNLRRWFRFELADYVKKMLLDDKTLNRVFFNKRFVEEMVNAHVSGRGNYTTEINRVLSLELAVRNLIDES